MEPLGSSPNHTMISPPPTTSEGFWTAMAYSIEVSATGVKSPTTSDTSLTRETVSFPSAEVERHLIRRALLGDQVALFKILRAHQPVIQSYVRRYARSYPALQPDDLNSEAQIALIESLKKFDLSKGVRFVTFLKWSLLAAFQNLVAGFAAPIKIPRREFQRGVETGTDSRVEGQPTVADEGVFDETPNLETNLPSLDASPEESEVPFSSQRLYASKVGMDTISELASEQTTALAGMIERQELESLLERFEMLDTRQRDVLQRYFGIDCEPESLAEIGESQGVSRQRAGQILSSALESMRRAIT